MKTFIILILLLCSVDASSWFGGSAQSTPYASWSADELEVWLVAHNVPLPSDKHPTKAELKALVEDNWNTASAWTYDQYASAQKIFQDVRDAAFDQWDESRLREFLLEQGIVAPKGPKERLVLLAKSRYRTYMNAASSLSASASTAVHGDSFEQATKSASSVASQATAVVAQATKDAMRALDDAKDYVYSAWDDNRLRSYLESKGVTVREEVAKNRNELLKMMHGAYAKITDPIWEAWSDSYIHEWLVAHNILSPSPPKPYSREYLLAKMRDYYYDVKDTAYSSWSDSELKNWLVNHDIIKSEAQIKRDKLLKLVQDNYYSTTSTFWDAWSDNQIHDWLVERGYLRSDAQVKRDELIKLANARYDDALAKLAPYLVWPDARLRVFLREHGMSEDLIPGSRPGLLQETRIRWIQAQYRAEDLWARVRDLVNGVEEGVEERLGKLWELMRAGWMQGRERAARGFEETREEGGRRWSEAEKKYEQEKERAYARGEKVVEEARETVGETVKKFGERLKGEL